MNVNVTSPSVPNQKTFSKYLKELYRTRMLTTNGKLVKKLENKLKKKIWIKIFISNLQWNNFFRNCIKNFRN